MLVLSRKVGQEIVIDGNIRVRIVQSNGNRISIGVEAPEEVSILRSELTDRPPSGKQLSRLGTSKKSA